MRVFRSTDGTHMLAEETRHQILYTWFWGYNTFTLLATSAPVSLPRNLTPSTLAPNSIETFTSDPVTTTPAEDEPRQLPDHQPQVKTDKRVIILGVLHFADAGLVNSPTFDITVRDGTKQAEYGILSNLPNPPATGCSVVHQLIFSGLGGWLLASFSRENKTNPTLYLSELQDPGSVMTRLRGVEGVILGANFRPIASRPNYFHLVAPARSLRPTTLPPNSRTLAVMRGINCPLPITQKFRRGYSLFTTVARKLTDSWIVDAEISSKQIDAMASVKLFA